jgi:uncharacterized protein YuzE
VKRDALVAADPLVPFFLSTTTATMSSKMDRRTLIAAARRILGRAESDERAVPAMFLTHLKAWLERHPNEDKFELSLDEGGNVEAVCFCNASDNLCSAFQIFYMHIWCRCTRRLRSWLGFADLSF